MTPERTDLIEKLKALEPTEGEWDDSYGIIECNDVALFDRRSATTSDCQLITLAPQMRLAILEMDEDITSLKQQNSELRLEVYKNNRKPRTRF